MIVIHQRNAESHEYICTFGEFETKVEAYKCIEQYEQEDKLNGYSGMEYEVDEVETTDGKADGIGYLNYYTV